MWLGTISVLTSALWLSSSRGAYVDPAILDACSGYVAKNPRFSNGGSEARIDLSLRDPGCGVFGTDVPNLQLIVTYETETRLHVKIVDEANERYEVSENVFPRPKFRAVSPLKSRLSFNYTADPFSFVVSRRLTGETLFSTKNYPLIFEDQYLRVKTLLPSNANIYGLGEHTETFRLDLNNAGRGTTRTLWSRDAYGIPNGTNLYSNHPVYFEHRTTGTHGVLLLNSNGMDVKLNQTFAGSTLEYNVIGGVLDFYFLAGSETKPEETAKQYAELAGLPAEVPYWGLGFHQCRFGYKDYVHIASVIQRYKSAGIPLETMWADIDYMDRRLIFTTDPDYFPLNRFREIVDHLHKNNQHFITMTDPAVGYLTNEEYGPLQRGKELDIFLKNQNGSDHLGVVWPGVTVFPDWFHPNLEKYWTTEFARFYSAETGLDIDGSWIDMNEPASFCNYPCNDPFGEAVSQVMPPPRSQAPPAPDVPLFVDGQEIPTTPYVPAAEEAPNAHVVSARELPLSARQEEEEAVDLLLDPPYAIDNAAGALSSRTAYTNVIHANGLSEYDTHNLYGTMMSTSTRKAMIARRPSRRPFIITRSTFAGAGRDVGKWLGDNLSTWWHYRNSIAGMLNFASVFAVPVVGSDVCGFGGNTTVDLCSRWAMLGAFNPFFRNHNGDTSISQEFYEWPEVAAAAKAAIDIRYRLLDYFYTALHASHVDGTPVLSPLFYKYPKDTATFPLDLQFFYGPSVLVSPVTEENSKSVRYYLPRDTWYNFLTLAPTTKTGWTTQTNIGYTSIPLHIQGGSIIPLRSESAMTIAELRTKPYDLLVAPAGGRASGNLYLDDGETIEPSDRQTTFAQFTYRNGRLVVDGRFAFAGGNSLAWRVVKFLGVDSQPKRVLVDGKQVGTEKVKYDRATKVLEVEVAIAGLKAFEVTLN